MGNGEQQDVNKVSYQNTHTEALVHGPNWGQMYHVLQDIR